VIDASAKFDDGFLFYNCLHAGFSRLSVSKHLAILYLDSINTGVAIASFVL